MTLHWTKEDDPRWDADKQRLFGPADLAAVDLDPPAAGTPVADEWWQVTGDDGQVAGYGWLDSEWGDAQITFWVNPARRGAGVGEFILDHLEDEAAARGLNYIYNVVPASTWLAVNSSGHSAATARAFLAIPGTPGQSVPKIIFRVSRGQLCRA